MVNSLGGSYREPGFGSQHLHSGSQSFVTPILGAPESSLGLCRYYMHLIHIHKYWQNTHAHKINQSQNFQVTLKIILSGE